MRFRDVWSQDYKHDVMMTMVSDLEDKSTRLQTLLLGDLVDMKKMDTSNEAALERIR